MTLHGLLVRWGLLRHPFGRDYAKRNYDVFGRWRGHPGKGDGE